MPLEFSIVIPSHQRTDLLQVCLESIQSHAPRDTEILVVDDGSPDGSVSQVAAYFGLVALRCSKPRGFCAAANAGIAASHGRVVELLNDDTEVTAGWSEKAMSHLEKAAVASVAPLVLSGPKGQNPTPRIDSAGDRYFVGGIAGKRGHGNSPGSLCQRPGRVFGASASSAFYRRETLLKVCAFPEGFRAYFEDIDLSFRLQRAGYEIVFEPRSLVWHHGGASHEPGRRLLEQQSHNEEQVFWRNLPGACLRKALPAHAAVLAAKAWRRWGEGKLSPFLWGRMRLLGEIPSLLKYRRKLQQQFPAQGMDGWHVEERFWDNLI